MASFNFEQIFQSPKRLSPETEENILAEARAAAAEVTARIDEFERMASAELVRRQDEVYGLLAPLTEQFEFRAPQGLGFEPEVIAYREWVEDGAFRRISNELRAILDGIPNQGYQRFVALASSLPKLVIAQDVISANARKGGRAKVAKNAKSQAKAKAKMEAKALWLERESGRQPKLRTEDSFAIEVCRRWPVLGSIGTIRKWSTQWRKEAAATRVKCDD